jgi:two-component system response regulator
VNNKFVILVADDDANDLRLLRRAVSGDGLDVELLEVRDGEELVDYLKGEGRFADRTQYPKPDLLLIDLKMPRMDGLQVLDWLGQYPEHSRVPAVMFSGSGLERDVEEAYRRGANTYFTKPSEFDELQRLVRVAIEYWKMSARRPGSTGWLSKNKSTTSTLG